MLIHEGPLTQERITSIFNNVEQKLDSKKALKIVVELLQNVAKHADTFSVAHADKEPVFFLYKEDTHYSIVTRNVVRNEKVASLIDKLTHINSLDSNGLNDLYKSTITKETSLNNNAGLGLIEVARNSNGPLRFTFTPIDDEYSLFLLKVISLRQ